MHSTVRDITERKKMEDALRESEETFRAITESSLSAVMLANTDSHVTFWNPSAVRMFGYSAEEALRLNLYQLIAPGRISQDAFSRQIQYGQRERTESGIGNGRHSQKRRPVPD